VLRGNLSTRPFYNQRLVTLGLALAAVVAIALTAFNVSQFTSLTRERSELERKIERSRSEAAIVRGGTKAVYSQLDRPALKALAGSAEEANRLIESRVFSWTTFLSGIESRMPMNVHLISISPRAERGVFQVELNVVAKSLEDLQQFIDALATTGTFYDVFAAGRKVNDDGTIGAVIRTGYHVMTSTAMPDNGAAKRGRP
jgi:hypothetical protein